VYNVKASKRTRCEARDACSSSYRQEASGSETDHGRRRAPPARARTACNRRAFGALLGDADRPAYGPAGTCIGPSCLSYGMSGSDPVLFFSSARRSCRSASLAGPSAGSVVVLGADVRKRAASRIETRSNLSLANRISFLRAAFADNRTAWSTLG
jgi:hypothetical protein